jgi:hypothetical protein
MQTVAWAIVGLLLLLFLVLMWLELARQVEVQWERLVGYYPGSLWFCREPAQMQRLHLVDALQAAEGFLILHTRWSAANLAWVGHAVRVYVQSEGLLASISERRAREEAGTLVVQPNLDGLCLELARLCALMLDDDYWVSVAAANVAYVEWLKKRTSQSAC